MKARLQAIRNESSTRVFHAAHDHALTILSRAARAWVCDICGAHDPVQDPIGTMWDMFNTGTQANDTQPFPL